MVQKNSPMIEKLRRDELVVSVKLNVSDAVIAELAAYAGFDAVWLDMEHCPSDYQEIKNAFYAAKARGAETIVRTPRGAYSNLTRPLEMDAAAIMVPHVMSKQDAEQVAHYTKFHPIGRRPIDGGNGDGMYCLMGTEDYIKYSNEQKLTIIQIEDIEAYEQIEEIAAVPGIDMLFFGPADFSHSIGEPVNIGNDRTMEAKRRVAEVARRHGKLAGTVGGVGNMRELYDMGYRLINLGADVVALGAYFTDIMKNVNEWKKEM
ncbi:MAG: aldolase [Clostridia bacterium]|nr:aldolase [Clostridia bacterium]